jgi:hypothetical protein
MASKLRSKLVVVLYLIFLLGVLPLYSKQENSNYYLGVLAKGYPPSLVAGELRFANARVVSIKDNMVLFGINEKTKLTTFLKNLPFLQEVYVDAADISRNDSLKKNPLVREFFSLSKRNRLKEEIAPQSRGDTPHKTVQDVKKEGSSPEPTMAVDKQTKTAPTGNMALIDRLIREKAKAIQAKKEVGKKL